MSTAEQANHDRFLGRARQLVGADIWQAALDEGRAAPLEPLIERVLVELGV